MSTRPAAVLRALVALLPEPKRERALVALAVLVRENRAARAEARKAGSRYVRLLRASGALKERAP